MSKLYALVFNGCGWFEYAQKKEISERLKKAFFIGSIHSLDEQGNYIGSLILPEEKSEKDLVNLIQRDGRFIAGETKEGTIRLDRPATIIPVRPSMSALA